MPPALVVDDSVLVCLMLTDFLKEQGFTVQVVYHGGPALDILRRSKEGMVVTLGLMMPLVNGEAVLEAVAEDETLAARHVFTMITAAVELAESGRIAALRNYLGVPLVPKPFKKAQITAAIDDATRRLHAKQQGILMEDSIRIAPKAVGEAQDSDSQGQE